MASIHQLPPALARIAGALRSVRRAVLARRRLLAALLIGLSVAAGLRSVTAPPPQTVAVLVARRDLAAGVVLRPSDVTTAEFTPGSVPSGLARDALGRSLASPLRRGEPVTDARLVGSALVDGSDGLVALPVRIPDAVAVGLLRAGDRIDLFATDPQAGGTRVLGADLVVLAVPDAGSPEAGGALPGRLVVLAVVRGTADDLADAAVQEFLSFAFSG